MSKGSPLKFKNYLLIILVAVSSAVLASFLTFVFLKKLPSTVVQQSKQVVVDQQTAVSEAAKKVGPSVVSIVASSSQINPFTGNSQSLETGAGTGIVVTKEGLILTNKHVVQGGETFNIYTPDNKEYKDAKVIAVDKFNDVAFLLVDANDLVPATLGNSDQTEVGQTVIAIGNALGQFQNTVTTGVISGKSRPIVASSGNGSSENLTNLFQTDAAINPGNSGGPLVNIEGQVIGMNTATAGSAQNIGFAIPINDIKTALESVIKTGKIVRPYLGIRYVLLNKDIATANNLSTSEGALVYASGNQLAVLPGSPASKAGLKEGDIITKLDSTILNKDNSISSVLARKKVGDTVEVVYLRDGETKTAKVKLEASN